MHCQFKNLSEEEAQKKAALATWTGKLAQELGFTVVDSIDTIQIKEKRLKRIVFRKPDN